MRIDREPRRAGAGARASILASSARLLVLSSLVLLAACPGTLDHKERFLVDGLFTDAAPADALLAAAGDAASTDDAHLVVVDGAGAPDAGGPCDDVPTRVFIPNCGGSACHGGPNPQQGLDLESAGVAARVVGIAGKECAGLLADPMHPDLSLLYVKLLASNTCGSQMPLARPPLFVADIACIKTWIPLAQ